MILLLNKKKIQGCYWGLALGDALGKPVEFSSMEYIKERYGEAKYFVVELYMGNELIDRMTKPEDFISVR